MDTGLHHRNPPIMMMEPYFEIFGQAAGPVPYYYMEYLPILPQLTKL